MDASTSTTPSQPTAAKPLRDDEAEDSRLCNKWVESALTNNKSIQYMVQHLIDLGCQPPDRFIRCMSCKEPAAGGFGMVEETILKKNQSSKPTTTKEQCQRTMEDLQKQLEREKTGETSLAIKPEICKCCCIESVNIRLSFA